MPTSHFSLPIFLTAVAVASCIVPPYVFSQGNQESENVADQFIKNVELRQWRAAESLARRSPEFASTVLLKRWQALRDSNDPRAKRIRLETIEFLLRHCENGRSNRPGLREDYFALLKDQNISYDRAAVTPETIVLFDRYKPQPSLAESEAGRAAIQECLDILRTRPNDSAAMSGLAAIYGSYVNWGAGQDLALDYQTLLTVCNTKQSRIKLSRILLPFYGRTTATVDAAGQKRLSADPSRDAAIKGLVFEVLRYMQSSEESAELVWNFYFPLGSVRDPQLLDEATDYLKLHFPGTLYTRVALARKLERLAKVDGLASAKRELARATAQLPLNSPQIVDLQIAIVQALESNDLARDYLHEILRQPIERTSRSKALDVAIQIASQVPDRAAMEKWPKERLNVLAPGETLPYEIAPIIAGYFMSENRWSEAAEVWKLWNLDDAWCAVRDVQPRETKRQRIAICQLFQSQYDEALQTIVDGMLEGSGSELPYLLFQIYERADQLEDLERIAISWEASGNTLSGGLPFERLGTDRPALHLPAEQDWGVRRLFKLRDLAEAGDLESLVHILRNSHQSCFVDKRYLPPYTLPEFSTSNILAREAASHLASFGEQGVQSIQRDFEQSQGRMSDWFLYSLLENKSPTAVEWMLELGSSYLASLQSSCYGSDDRREGENVRRKFNDLLLVAIASSPRGRIWLERLAAQPDNGGVIAHTVALALERNKTIVSTSPAWPAPPPGSLPAMIEFKTRP